MNAQKIALTDEQSSIVQKIFSQHPGAYVFGSRITGKSKLFSDLDICFIRKEPISDLEVSLLKEKCEESDLPFFVDIIDYHQISDTFKKIVDKNKVPLKCENSK